MMHAEMQDDIVVDILDLSASARSQESDVIGICKVNMYISHIAFLLSVFCLVFLSLTHQQPETDSKAARTLNTLPYTLFPTLAPTLAPKAVTGAVNPRRRCWRQSFFAAT